MDVQSSLFALFSLIIVGFLVLDLRYFNRKSHTIEFRQALYQTLWWVGISLIFSFLVFLYLGRESAAEFITAYVTEKMLSVDNLFVILLIFSFFKLDEKYHHRVLFWGILGAILFRAIFICAGAYIVGQFHFVLYIFGAILVYTGAALLGRKREEHVDLERSKLLKSAKKFLPISQKHHDGRFFLKENGKLKLTTLFLIMLLVEEMDILFAVDSIPAVFAISQNTFIIFTSNIFAIMGLRSLFFLLESVIQRFHHLQKGLAFLLLFIGAKMLLGIWNVHISSISSFIVIIFILTASIMASIYHPKKYKLPFYDFS
jgi:tellurite resistance protein TerC